MNGLQQVAFGFKDRFQMVRMVVVPFFLAAPAVVLWYWLQGQGFHSTKEADEPIVNAILPLVGMIHTLLFGFMFNVKEKANAVMRQAIREGNEAAFLIAAQDRISLPMRFVMFTTAMFIECWTMSLHYASYWTGFASVYSVGYLLSLLWEVIADLDDPANGVWVLKGIPPGWLTKANIKPRLSDRIFEMVFGKRGPKEKASISIRPALVRKEDVALL